MHYYLRVKGQLAPSWQGWFAPLQLAHDDTGNTILAGTLPDQAALYGILLKLDRLALTLLSLANRDVEASEAEVQPVPDHPTRSGIAALATSGAGTAVVLDSAELPGERSKRFEGHLYGDVPISFFLAETPPGSGPELHSHPYAEVFVIQEGSLTFVVGDATLEATQGQIVIAPADVPHRFTNTSKNLARHVNMHTAAPMVTTWLDDLTP